MKEKKINKIGLIFITVVLTVVLSFGSLAVSYFYSPNFKTWVDYTIRQQGTVDEQANTINDQAETISGLQADLTALNNQLNTVTEQRDVALGEKQQLLLDIADLEGEIADMQEQLNDAFEQHVDDALQIELLQDLIIEKNNLINQKNATITQLNNEIANLEQDIEDLNDIITLLEQQILLLENETKLVDLSTLIGTYNFSYQGRPIVVVINNNFTGTLTVKCWNNNSAVWYDQTTNFNYYVNPNNLLTSMPENDNFLIAVAESFYLGMTSSGFAVNENQMINNAIIDISESAQKITFNFSGNQIVLH